MILILFFAQRLYKYFFFVKADFFLVLEGNNLNKKKAKKFN